MSRAHRGTVGSLAIVALVVGAYVVSRGDVDALLDLARGGPPRDLPTLRSCLVPAGAS